MHELKSMVIFLSALSAGCASVPRLPNEYGVLRISDIVDNIRCEIKEGRQSATFLKERGGWNAAVDLSLNVVSDAGGGFGGVNEVPYTPQLLTLTLNTNVKGSADRTVGFVFTTDLGLEDGIDCAPIETRRHKNSRLVGDLGITSWLLQLQNIYAETQARPDKVSYTLQFMVEQSADSSIKITKIPFNESQANLGFSLKGSWKDVNKMSIIFAPKPNAPKAAPVSPPKPATKPAPGVKPKSATPPPPAVDPSQRQRLLDDLQLQIIQQRLDL
ncbi:hypothetical protein ACHMW7_08820 [Aminobacter sp. UC22_36]|uniref:hypothetical protein n=1 Tax=Aminobacter sp. UC22_36 TaxID=3374549 RepID=UPI00375777D0